MTPVVKLDSSCDVLEADTAYCEINNVFHGCQAYSAYTGIRSCVIKVVIKFYNIQGVKISRS